MEHFKIIYHACNEDFVEDAIEIINESAEKAIKANGKFHFVLTGGETPKHIYKRLQQLNTDWKAWELFISDERMGHLSDDQLNQFMIRNEFLNYVPIMESQIHFIDNYDNMQLALISYNRIISNCPVFDLTLLGIGEDGHVASLFPEHDLGLSPDSPDVMLINNSPKPPAQRISLSMNRLNKSQKVLMIASGERKRNIVSDFSKGIEMPALHLKAFEETVLLYCSI